MDPDLLNKPQCITFPTVSQNRGKLNYIEGEKHIPFNIRRVYYVYDTHVGSERGNHAMKTEEKVLIALSGSFEIHLDNGNTTYDFTLNQPHQGLYIPPLVWLMLDNFSDNAICLALVSNEYDPDDYLTDYNAFLEQVRR